MVVVVAIRFNAEIDHGQGDDHSGITSSPFSKLTCHCPSKAHGGQHQRGDDKPSDEPECQNHFPMGVVLVDQ